MHACMYVFVLHVCRYVCLPRRGSVPGLSAATVALLACVDVHVARMQVGMADRFPGWVVAEPVLNTMKALIIFHRDLAGKVT
jgi:hypothetical protein